MGSETFVIDCRGRGGTPSPIPKLQEARVVTTFKSLKIVTDWLTKMGPLPRFSARIDDRSVPFWYRACEYFYRDCKTAKGLRRVWGFDFTSSTFPPVHIFHRFPHEPVYSVPVIESCINKQSINQTHLLCGIAIKPYPLVIS